MKKLLISLLVLLGIAAFSLWYFEPFGYNLNSVVSMVTGKKQGVSAQGMWNNQFMQQGSQQQQSSSEEPPVATDITRDNFLDGLDETQVNSVWVTYSLDGELRTSKVFVSVPEGFNSSNDSWPLFLAFHGTAGSGEGAAGSMANKHKNDQFIFIAPVGGQSEDGEVYTWSADLSGEDDVKFTQTMWDAIKSDDRINKDKVYAYGSSVGSSFLSNDLLVGVDFIKGAGCFSSTIHEGNDVSGAPTPISVINIHGEDDPMIPINGGPTSFSPYTQQMAENDAIKMWAKHNDDSPGGPVEDIRDDYTRVSYSCNNGAVVELYRLNDTGHNSEQRMGEITGMTTGEWLLSKFETAPA